VEPIEWLLGNDTGTSSKTILSVMTGANLAGNFGPDIPYDGGDFGRCHRLLQHFPEWRERLSEVAVKYPKWGPMVVAWDELTELYEAENHHRMYERMKDLVDEGRLADGWTKTGPGCWRGPARYHVDMGNGVSMSFAGHCEGAESVGGEAD
jgi:hypothetical protein